MWNVLLETAERARTSLKLAKKSGLMWALRREGAIELGRILRSGSQNPALIYRMHAKNSPTKPAIHWHDKTETWGELNERIDRIGAGLARRGIRRGKSVILMMRNRPEFVELGAAGARSGVAFISVSWRSTSAELAYLANHSGAAGIFLEPELMPIVERARDELSEEFLRNVIPLGPAFESLLEDPTSAEEIDASGDSDAAVVVYTSGTTGKPKGAVRRFPKNTMLAAFRFINETPMRVDDVHLVACPLYHSTAFGFLSLTHVLGGTVVLMDEFKPEAFLALVEPHAVSTVAVVPTMLRRILDLPESVRKKYDTRSLRAVFCGGAALSATLATEFMDTFGDVLFNFYGATETGLVTLAKPADLRATPGTIGKALPGSRVRLLDEDKHDVGAGAVGELYVKSDLLVAGYHRDDDATRASMLEGFFSVGDLARVDADGRYFIEGRKRDLIISGGVNIYPAEVEEAIQQHPKVAEAAVVGVPHREWGESARAFVVRRAGALLDEGELKIYLRDRLSGPKVPQSIVFLDSLPRNPTGKVLKRELRERD